ncbi:MAG: thioredoxin [Dehalococcoidia bacterium]|nr:MAG: thioredoxin [Dehalococcoidia bacterium]
MSSASGLGSIAASRGCGRRLGRPALTYPSGVYYPATRTDVNRFARLQDWKENPNVAKPFEVTDASFDAEVIKSDTPVLVDFWAPWCGPCRMVAPIVDELSDEYDGKVKFVKLNTDDNVKTAAQYQIRSIPTLLVFKGGEPVGQIIGFRPKSDLKKKLDGVL